MSYAWDTCSSELKKFISDSLRKIQSIITSKQKAGIWGRSNPPKRFHAIIRQASEAYETEKSAAIFSESDLNRIRDYFKKSIEDQLRRI
ncbi:uncharacterized protein DUF4111 [Planomicrobium soli]|uniref:Uncharacterized protein DUF4111 n=2 Tax=Planomicrobium soli TaxID=1176648 RepID=A0A2P8GG48_9BACL|nr:uncharacterized protein DUF4111 [Planomicrobium soli]